MPLYQRKPQEIEAFRFGYDDDPDWFTTLVNQAVVTIRLGGDGRKIASVKGAPGYPDMYEGMWMIAEPRAVLANEVFNEHYTPFGSEAPDPRELERRQAALDLAIKAVGANDLSTLLAAAEDFLAFLKGGNNAPA